MMTTHTTIVNISMAERLITILGGIALVVATLRRAPLAIVVTTIGGFLIYRGLTGFCPIYRQLEIRSAEQSLIESFEHDKEGMGLTGGAAFPASDPPPEPTS